MPTARYGVGAIAWGELLYAVGGTNGAGPYRDISATVEVRDVARDCL
jgi:hypothetical protein